MIARSGEVAAKILNRRDPLRLKLGDETFTRIMLAEAYSQGLRDGLEKGKQRVTRLVEGVDHDPA